VRQAIVWNRRPQLRAGLQGLVQIGRVPKRDGRDHKIHGHSMDVLLQPGAIAVRASGVDRQLGSHELQQVWGRQLAGLERPTGIPQQAELCCKTEPTMLPSAVIHHFEITFREQPIADHFALPERTVTFQDRSSLLLGQLVWRRHSHRLGWWPSLSTDRVWRLHFLSGPFLPGRPVWPVLKSISQ
jgi:hypothetical protein